MKKLAIIFLIVVISWFGFIFLGNFLSAEDSNLSAETESEDLIEINFFRSSTCPHCAEEEEFLEELEGKYQIKVNRFLVSEKDNAQLLLGLYNEYEVPSELRGYIPATFVGGRYFIGYDTPEKIGWKIEHYIQELVVERLERQKEEKQSEEEPKEEPEKEEEQKETEPEKLEEGGSGEVLKEDERKISIPYLDEIKIDFQNKKIDAKLVFIGDIGINFSNKSPLFISILFGTLDGFNACAMVALGFLLAVLIGTRTRKRIFLIGGTFILVSGLVYFLIISAWMELFLCLSHIKLITTLIGIIVVIFSASLLKDYWRGITCKICELGKTKDNFLTRFQKKLFEKMEIFSSGKVSLPLSLLGIAVVAAGVNMVELCCSLGLPVAFTKMLSSFSLPGSSYHFYILIYVAFYMLDDFLIFLFAVLAMRITQTSEKYLKAVKLISGILLLVLGLIMIMRPELLTF